jgi:quercetin dioxygenase-like cupin family protein
MTRALLAAVIVAAVIGGLACGDDDGSSGGTSGQVTREILAALGSLEHAPGQELGLSRVVVPPGEAIAPHTHPGVQMAFIAEGTLTYTVHTLEAVVTRRAGATDARSERVAAGSTVELNPGDSLIEIPGMVHEAKNNGATAVVIYLSSLFEEGAPASSAATPPAP